jgi:hypothetical protein
VAKPLPRLHHERVGNPITLKHLGTDTPRVIVWQSYVPLNTSAAGQPTFVAKLMENTDLSPSTPITFTPAQAGLHTITLVAWNTGSDTPSTSKPYNFVYETIVFKILL